MALSSFQKAVNKGGLSGWDDTQMVVQDFRVRFLSPLSFKREGRRKDGSRPGRVGVQVAWEVTQSPRGKLWVSIALPVSRRPENRF